MNPNTLQNLAAAIQQKRMATPGPNAHLLLPQALAYALQKNNVGMPHQQTFVDRGVRNLMLPRENYGGVVHAFPQSAESAGGQYLRALLLAHAGQPARL